MKMGFYVEKDDGTTEKVDMEEVQKYAKDGQTIAWDPIKAVRCAAACQSRSGFAACVARCIATGEVCDSGLNNCSPL